MSGHASARVLGPLVGSLAAVSPLRAVAAVQVCNMLTMREFHRRYHDSTGIVFSALYPGCIAETGLFRNHVPLFRSLFPAFQKNITQGYVSEDEAGRRLASVVTSADYSESGAYWSWSGDSEAFINTPSEEVSVCPPPLLVVHAAWIAQSQTARAVYAHSHPISRRPGSAPRLALPDSAQVSSRTTRQCGRQWPWPWLLHRMDLITTQTTLQHNYELVTHQPSCRAG